MQKPLVQFKPNIGTNLRNAWVWCLLLALAVVQFNGHLHRIKHANLHGTGLAWSSVESISDDHAEGLSHYHSCALLDAASLGLGPASGACNQPPKVLAGAIIQAFNLTQPSGLLAVKLPPARAPPLFS